MPVLRYLETAIHRGASLPSESCEIKRSCCSNFGEQRLNAFAERDSAAKRLETKGYQLSIAYAWRLLDSRQALIARVPAKFCVAFAVFTGPSTWACARAAFDSTQRVCDVGDWVYRFGLAADRRGPLESACHPRLPDISLLLHAGSMELRSLGRD